MVDANAYWNVYREQGIAPPPVILYKGAFHEYDLADAEMSQRISGDPSIGANRTKWVTGWLKLTFWGLFILSSISLVSLMNPSNHDDFAWGVFLAMINTFLMSVFFIYQLSFATSRSAVPIDRGRIEFSKRFKRRTLTRDNALCFVTSMFGMVTLQWHRPDRALPAHTLYFHDPDDPRLATILNLWTADPLPDNPG